MLMMKVWIWDAIYIFLPEKNQKIGKDAVDFWIQKMTLNQNFATFDLQFQTIQESRIVICFFSWAFENAYLSLKACQNTKGQT